MTEPLVVLPEEPIDKHILLFWYLDNQGYRIRRCELIYNKFYDKWEVFIDGLLTTRPGGWLWPTLPHRYNWESHFKTKRDARDAAIARLSQDLLLAEQKVQSVKAHIVRLQKEDNE